MHQNLLLVTSLTRDRNINPRHLVEESGVMNKSRINCFLYMDTKLRASEVPRRQRTSDQIQTAIVFLSVEMNQCRLLHQATPCTLSWNAWMEDHPGGNVDMAEVYAQQTESEGEAEERLSGDDYGASDSFRTADPRSSQY